MIVIDEGRMHHIIRSRQPASVSLNGPDGMLPQVQDAAARIASEFGIPAYVIADTTWGTCDLNSSGASVLGADIHFNIGHTINSETIPGSANTILVDAYDDVRFDAVAKKCAEILHGKTISLLTDSQHLLQIRPVKEILESEGGMTVIVGRGGGQLNDGQVFGCEFYPAHDAASEGGADAHVFLGQSSFHAAGVALATGLATYVLDPYFGEVREVSDFAQKLRRKATLAIYKAAEARSFGVIVGIRCGLHGPACLAAAEARSFGVIVGLKEGQLSKRFALDIKAKLESAGKSVQLFAMTDITNERLANIRGIDAFVPGGVPAHIN